MLIISNEGALQHTDTCMDIIEHSGVKGMKWGHRAAKNIKTMGRGVVNSYLHPYLTTRSYSKHLADRGYAKYLYDNVRHPIKTTRKSNEFVAKHNQNKALKYGKGQYNLANNGTPKGVKGAAKVVGKGIKYQVTHPFLTGRAAHNKASKGLLADAYSNVAHPIRSTHEMNKYIDAHLAAKKAKKSKRA